MTTPRLIAFIAIALGFVGCAEMPRPEVTLAGPFFTPTNIKAISARMPEDIRRVLVLPIATCGPILAEENLTNLNTAIATELGRTARFEVVTVTRDELATLSGKRQLSSVEALPTSVAQKLFTPNNSYAVDAVLFVDLTTYSPYPPLNVGLRTKLARIRDQQIIWAADLIYDAALPTVANSARRHAKNLKNDAGPTDLSHTILQSPSRFTAYAAAATFDTLPTR